MAPRFVKKKVPLWLISTNTKSRQLVCRTRSKTMSFACQFSDTCSSSSYPDVEPQWSDCHGGSLTIPEPKDLLTENLPAASVFMRVIYTRYCGASSGLAVVKFRRLYLAPKAASPSKKMMVLIRYREQR